MLASAANGRTKAGERLRRVGLFQPDTRGSHKR
jgi:hypothetical protein